MQSISGDNQSSRRRGRPALAQEQRVRKVVVYVRGAEQEQRVRVFAAALRSELRAKPEPEPREQPTPAPKAPRPKRATPEPLGVGGRAPAVIITPESADEPWPGDPVIVVDDDVQDRPGLSQRR